MSITLKAQSNQFDEAKKESLRRRGWSWTNSRAGAAMVKFSLKLSLE